MHVCTLVGARPQFVKAAAVSPALKEAGIKETLIHSGQHYDELLSQVFFDELGVPPPISNLEVGSGSHAVQTGEIMVRLEQFIKETGPYDAVIVYGDTNTTLAGALVAAKGNIPLA
ncbi:MAG: UDP-N-acetylglucosamine 2-epimerase, partial [Bacteroidetes bacterium]|nr:UDP-N-acetylglucosamine 2-epimerase [Bacteroidota bacterium]